MLLKIFCYLYEYSLRQNTRPLNPILGPIINNTVLILMKINKTLHPKYNGPKFGLQLYIILQLEWSYTTCNKYYNLYMNFLLSK